MKNVVFILGLISSFNVMADDVTIVGQSDSNDASTKCGDNCTWTLYSNGKLEIKGTGDMYNYTADDTGTPLWEGTHSWQTTAPWGEYSTQISHIDISEGILSIGSAAFYHVAAQSVRIPEGVKNINGGAFQYSTLLNVTLPSTLETISDAVFYSTNIDNLIVPEGVAEIGPNALSTINTLILEGDTQFGDNAFWVDSESSVGMHIPTVVYCQPTNTSCNSLKNNEEIGDKIITYNKESGVYVLDGQMYASPIDMANTQNACVDMDICKAKVLQNKGYCSSNEACAAMVEAENANHPIEYKNKSYASIDDLLKGKHMPKRIYTIDEANAVTGNKNRVSIKYR